MINDKDYLDLLSENFVDFDFEKCSSYNVFAYAYNEKVNVLIVAFKGGKIYQYLKIKPSIYHGLQKAESKGKFINSQVIQKGFKYRKYEIQEPENK